MINFYLVYKNVRMGGDKYRVYVCDVDGSGDVVLTMNESDAHRFLTRYEAALFATLASLKESHTVYTVKEV